MVGLTNCSQLDPGQVRYFRDGRPAAFCHDAMAAHASFFDSRRLHSMFAPRKPRHPLARLAIGLLGVAVLAVLVFFSVFVGAAMLAVGLLYRLLRHRRRPPIAATRARVVDGEYRIVAKTALPSA